MKIAISSACFRRGFAEGALTHLEWLEGCASRLDADGVVFAAADLPRSDGEYTAQAKKVAVDLGLVPVALDAPGLLDPTVADAVREQALARAGALGCALLATTTGPAGELPPKTFVETVAVAKRLTKLAKEANLTVVVTPATDSVAADPGELRHLLKDVDSAWLRYGLPFDADRSALGYRDRVLLELVGLDADLTSIGERRGWFVLGGPCGCDAFATVGAAVEALRAAEARRRLSRV